MTRHWRSTSNTISKLVTGVVLVLGLSSWSGARSSAADLPKDPAKLTTGQAVDAYLAVLLDSQQTNIRRNYAGAKIVELGQPAVPVMLSRYKAAGREERGYLASLLGAMGKNDDAETVLFSDLKENKLAVGLNVIKALGQMNSAKALPVLIEILPRAAYGASADPALKLVILQAIADSGDLTSAPALNDGLDDNDRPVRIACANGLVTVLKRGQDSLKKIETHAERQAATDAYDKVLTRVMDYVKDGKSEDARLILMGGLGDLNEGRATRALLDVLDSGTNGLKYTAAETLGKLKSAAAVSRLVEMLKDKDASLRAASLKALVMIADMRCVPALIGQLGTAPVAERKEIVKGLRALTGQNFGDSPEAWQTWWTSQGR